MLLELVEDLAKLDADGKEAADHLVASTMSTKWVPNPGPQTDAFFSEADELFYGGCVSGETEFLTPIGWKRIDQYETGDLVAQWQESGEMSFVAPQGFTDEECEEMWHFNNSRMSMMLSDEHRMPLYDYQGKFVVKLAAEVAEVPSRHKVPVNYLISNDGLDMGESLIRLGVAIHADGSLTGNQPKEGMHHCRISLRKKRKRRRLERILSDLGIEWTEYHNPKRPTEVRYNFYSPIDTKEYSTWWAANGEQLAIMLDEMSHWDGAYSGAIGGDICFNSTIKEDADFIQYAAHACGRVATISIIQKENPAHSTMYRVHISKLNSSKGVVTLRGDAIKIDRVAASRKYCFKVPSSFWVARHNGFVFITGNSAGGGKSALAVGLAVTSHEKSLILRRIRDDAKALAEDELLGKICDGDRNGWNGQDLIYRDGVQRIDFGGCANETDKQRYKGRPHDLVVFDEVGDFLEAQYDFIIGWNRSTTPGQRCRVVATGNPPTTAEGLWVNRRWAAWLDPKHPNPAKSGEIRWYLRDENGEEKEVDSKGPHQCGDREVYAKSRSFIRARLEDNPDLMEDGQYEANLNNMKKDLRDAYRDGRFDIGINDHENQLIPTEWVLAAQNRWKPTPPEGVPMCAMGVDVGAGSDPHAITLRFDSWFSNPEEVESEPIEHGGDCAGKVLARRRDDAVIVIDCGGGYGGSAYKHFVDNHIPVIAYKGGAGTKKRTKHAKIPFKNTRTATFWQLREALDPDQPGGSSIAISPDQTLLAELTALRFYNKNNVITLEDKEMAKKRTGLGFHKADSLGMAHSSGNNISNYANGWASNNRITIKRGGCSTRGRRH